jgi:hypothetical protein
MPSTEVGAEVRRNRALNCWPWVRSFTHSPDAVIHSPAAIVAAWPTTVTRSRCPRAFARRTQNPFSALWKVTRSTRPARTSWLKRSGCVIMRIVASSGLLIARQGQQCANEPPRCTLATILYAMHSLGCPPARGVAGLIFLFGGAASPFIPTSVIVRAKKSVNMPMTSRGAATTSGPVSAFRHRPPARLGHYLSLAKSGRDLTCR